MLCITVLIILLTYFLLILCNVISTPTEWMKLYFPMLLTTVMCFLTFKTNKKMISLGASTVILIYMVLSVLSLLLLLPIFPEIEHIRNAYSMSFLYYPELIPSICIGSIGIISFTIFSSIFANFKKDDTVNNIKLFGNGISDMEERTEPICDRVALFALIILIISLIYFLFLSLGNTGYFINSYGKRMSATNDNRLYSYFIIIMALSFVMYITTTNKKRIMYGIVVFALISLIQFLLGNRGEVFYPTLAAIAVYRKRGGTFKKKYFYIALCGVLIIIPMIRIVRNIGVLSIDFKSLVSSFNVFSAIAESFGEMGFQIGTITYMLRYLNTGGLLQHGATYVYSFHYFLYNKIPFLPAINLNSPAAIKTIMPTNYFAFTNIGEAYFNFGVIGVILFSGLLSFYLYKTEKKSKKLFLELFNNLMLVEMLAWVRNSSGTLPVYISWSIALIILAYLFSSMVKIKSKQRS